MESKTAWDELDELISESYAEFNLSFGLEYSSVVDWFADITPRRNHPQAREYGKVWAASAGTRDDAVRKAIERAREGMALQRKRNQEAMEDAE